MRTINFVFSFVLITVLSGCSGNIEQDKPYTPLYLYYNQLEIDKNLTSYFPYFVNYPTDWSKMGLKGSPSDVKYFTGIQEFGQEIYFLYQFMNSGKLLFWGMSNEMPSLTAFSYDDHGRLEGIVHNPFLESQTNGNQQFRYRNNRLVSLTNNAVGVAEHSYSYYEDGTLKKIEPIIGDDYLYTQFSEVGIMEFDTLGRLVRTEAPRTNNPMMEDLINPEYDVIDLPSVCTYSYTDNLCTEKLEKIAFFIRGELQDTIICRSRYIYNSYGDIETCEYEGGYYIQGGNNGNPIGQTKFTVHYSYEYDGNDNWTTLRITLPDNLDQYHGMLKFYELQTSHRYISNQRSYSPTPGEKPEVTFRREINYYEKAAEEVSKMDNVEESDEEPEEESLSVQGETPRFTSVQGYGLYGRVREVTEGGTSKLRFDEYGNLIFRTDEFDNAIEYNFQSPTKYLLATGEGPFHVVCEGNLRKEIDENGIELTIEYEFDNSGRVIRHRYIESKEPVEKRYIYEGDEKFPSEMVCEYSFEDGSSDLTSKYVYTDFDQHGNWTERTVNSSWKYIRYNRVDNSENISTRTEPETTETRTIFYF